MNPLYSIPNVDCDDVVSHRVKRTPTTFRLPNSKNNSPFANRAGSKEPKLILVVTTITRESNATNNAPKHWKNPMFWWTNRPSPPVIVPAINEFWTPLFQISQPIWTHHSLRPIHLHHQSTCLKQPQTTQSRPNNSNLLNHTMLNTNLHNYNRV